MRRERRMREGMEIVDSSAVVFEVDDIVGWMGGVGYGLECVCVDRIQ